MVDPRLRGESLIERRVISAFAPSAAVVGKTLLMGYVLILSMPGQAFDADTYAEWLLHLKESTDREFEHD
jgi:hypothetical protein